ITKGTRIMQYIGAKIPKAESAERLAQGNASIFALNDRYDIDGRTLKHTARSINHSCDPNCEAQRTYRSIWIVALRDIPQGEELTHNDGCEIDGEPPEPCHCGAHNCCGFILAPQYWNRITSPERRSKDANGTRDPPRDGHGWEDDYQTVPKRDSTRQPHHQCPASVSQR